MSLSQRHQMHAVANALALARGWHAPDDEDERWVVNNFEGSLPVRVKLMPHVDGIQVQVHIPQPPDGTGSPRPDQIVWLGVVSHTLGEGYVEALVAALVDTYLGGWLG